MEHGVLHSAATDCDGYVEKYWQFLYCFRACRFAVTHIGPISTQIYVNPALIDELIMAVSTMQLILDGMKATAVEIEENFNSPYDHEHFDH